MGDDYWIRRAVEEHSGALLRYAGSILGNEDQARDVIQDVYARLCAVPRGRVEPHLVEWLFTVCRNRCLDVLRKERRMQPLTELESDELVAVGPGPDAVAARRDAAGHVLGLLAGLPPRQQEVVRLKFQSGLSYEEISRVTRLSVSNVGFLLHTAIRSLRQQVVPLSETAVRTERGAS